MSLGNVLIFGDSYSTFKGFIPKGYADYYRPEGNPKTDLLHVEETWWHKLITKTESTLLLNDSWSGSTVCNTGYNGDCSKTNSFIYKCKIFSFTILICNKLSRKVTIGKSRKILLCFSLNLILRYFT